jgi:hypothetical protein
MDKEKQNEPESTLHFVDESYRMDDNPNYSEIALNENEIMDDPLIPGIGTETE